MLNDFLQGGQTSISDALFVRFSQTKLTHSEFLVYLFLLRAVERQEDWNPAAFAESVRLNPGTLKQVMQTLADKKAIVLRDNQLPDVTPLLQAVLTPVASNDDTPESMGRQSQADIFSTIETEFGRPLSPIEQQTIRDWLQIDHYQPDLITLALREAVLNQAYSLRYIDRILIDWEKRHLTTVAQVQAEQSRRREW